MTTIAIAAMPVKLNEGVREFSVQLRDPGVVRSVAYSLEKRLVMAGAGGAQFDEVLTMYIEVAADGPLRNRRFVVLESNEPMKVADGHKLLFCGTAVSSNTGQVAHIFEAKGVA